MFGLKRDIGFLNEESRYTATDIFYIEDLFEQIGLGENRLNYLFKEQGYNACDKIKEELLSLINCYELLKEKTQCKSHDIEDRYSSRLKEVKARIDELLGRAKKLSIELRVDEL